MTTSSLHVVIDPSGARSGADQVVSSLNRMGNSATDFMNRSTGAFSSFERSISSATTKLTAFLTLAASYVLHQMSDRMIQVNLVYNSFIATMTMVTGSARKAREEFEYLTDYSNKLGASVEETAKVYGTLAASLKMVDKTGESTRHIFEAISQAQAVLHLRGDQTNGIFIALEQSISKGKVSLEEFQKQLGNRLPDAMGISARGMEMTKKIFREAITEGSIDPLKTVLALANQIKIEYGDSAKIAADMFNAQVMRMKNAVFQLYLTVGQNGAMDGLAKIVKSISDMLSNPETGKALGQSLEKMFTGIADWISTIKAEDIRDLFSGIATAVDVVSFTFKELGKTFFSTSNDGKTSMVDMAEGFASVFIILTDMIATFVSALAVIPTSVNSVIYDVRYAVKNARASLPGTNSDEFIQELEQLRKDREQAIKTSDAFIATLLGSDDSPLAKAWAKKQEIFGKLRVDLAAKSAAELANPTPAKVQDPNLGEALSRDKLNELASQGSGAPGSGGNKGRGKGRDVFNTESTNLVKLATVANLEYQNSLDGLTKSENLNVATLTAKLMTDKNYIALTNDKKVALLNLALAADQAQSLERSASAYASTKLDNVKSIAKAETEYLAVVEHKNLLESSNQDRMLEKMKYDSEFINMSSDMKAVLLNQAAALDELSAATERAKNMEQSRFTTMIDSLRTQRELSSISQGKGPTQFNEEANVKDSFLEGGSNQFASMSEQSALLADAVIRDANAMKLALANIYDPSKAFEFGNAMNSSMVPMAEGIEKLVNTFENFRLKTAEISKEREMANKSYAQGSKELADVMVNIKNKETKLTISSYADMAGAAKGFVKEGTAGYRALENAEKLFRATEMAQSLYAFAVKSGLTTAFTGLFVASKATETAADTTSTGASVANSGIRATADGIAGVAKAIASMPFPANLAAGAATIAALVAIGVRITGGGGGGGVTQPTAAQVQKTQGTGTVFGDSTAKSESLTNSIELLQDTSSQLVPLNQGMLNALKNIESSMGGLTNIVIRTGGIADGSNYNGKTGTFGTAAGDMAGRILVPVADSFTQKLLTATTNFLFGSSKSQLTDSGLQVGGSFNNLKEGGGVNQYTTVQTDKKGPLGGIFGGNSSYSTVNTNPVSSEISQQFSAIFTSVGDALKAADKALGNDGTRVVDTLNNFTLSMSNISLKGLSGEAMTTALNSVISKSLDEIAMAVFPQFESFRQVGEGYAQTVFRIANTFALVNHQFELIDATLFKTVDAAYASKLAEKFGGIENLLSTTSSYFDKYFTTAEKTIKRTNEMTNAFVALGVPVEKVPTDLAGMRDMITAAGSAASLATDQGRTLFAGLMQLSDAFYDLKNGSDKATKSVDNIAESLDKLKDSRQAVSAALESVSRSIQDLADNVIKTKQDTLNAETNIRNAYFSAQDAVTAAQKRIADLSKASASSLSQFSDQIEAFVKGLAYNDLGSNTGQAAYAATKNQLSETSNRLMTTDPSKWEANDQKNLLNLATSFLKSSKEVGTSAVSFAKDEVFVKNLLNGIKTKSDNFVTPLPVAGQTAPVVKTEMEIANAALATAMDNLAAATKAAQVTNVSITKTLDNTYTKLVEDYRKAVAAGLKAQTDYADGLALTAGLNLTLNTSIQSLVQNYAALKAAEEALAKAQTTGATDIVSTTKAFAAGIASQIGLTGEAASKFTTELATSLLKSGFDGTLKNTVDSAKLLASQLGLTGDTATKFVTELNKSLTSSGLTTTLLQASHLLSGSFEVNKAAATAMAEKLGLSGLTLTSFVQSILATMNANSSSVDTTTSAATLLASNLGLTGSAAIKFVNDLQTYLKTADIENLFKNSGAEAKKLATDLGLTGTAANDFVVSLRASLAASNMDQLFANSGQVAAELATKLGLTGTAAAEFINSLKNAMVTSNIDAMFKNGATEAFNLAKMLGLSGTAADAFVANLKSSLTSSNLDTMFKDGASSASDLAAKLGLTGSAADVFINQLKDSVIKSDIVNLFSGGAGAAKLLSDKFGLTAAAADTLMSELKKSVVDSGVTGSFNLSSESAKILATKFGLSGAAANQFVTELQDSIAKSGVDATFNMSSDSARLLAGRLGLTGLAADTFVNELRNSVTKSDIANVLTGGAGAAKLLTDKFGLTGVAADTFIDSLKTSLIKSNLDATFKEGSSSARELAVKLGLSGTAADTFISQLRDSVTKSDIANMLTGGASAAKILTDKLGLTGIAADTFMSELKNTVTGSGVGSSFNLSSEAAKILATKFGLSGLAADQFVVELQDSIAKSGIDATFNMSSESAKSLATKLGLTGTAADTFVNELKNSVTKSDIANLLTGGAGAAKLLTDKFGLTGVAADGFIKSLKDTLITSNIDGMFKAGSSSASDLAAKLGLTGTAATNFISQLKDSLIKSDMTTMFSNGAASAYNLATKLGLTGSAADTFVNSLKTSYTTSNLDGMFKNGATQAYALATKLGLSGTAADNFVTYLKTSLLNSDISNMLNSSSSAARDLANKLGYTGQSADAFVTALRTSLSNANISGMFATAAGAVSQFIQNLNSLGMTKFDYERMIQNMSGSAITALVNLINKSASAVSTPTGSGSGSGNSNSGVGSNSSGSTNTLEATVRNWYARNPMANKNPDAQGLVYWMNAIINQGHDVAKQNFSNSVAALTGTGPASIYSFATGGDFAGGMRIVGEHGPELEMTGASKIFTASQTKSILNEKGGDPAVYDKLMEEIVMLRKEVERQSKSHQNTADNTKRVVDKLNALSPDNVTLNVKVA